jgi:hypothetical protein
MIEEEDGQEAALSRARDGDLVPITDPEWPQGFEAQTG